MTTQNNGQAVAQQNGNQAGGGQLERNVSENVMNRIKIFQETGTLHLPENYSAPNALRIAWLILQETKTQDKRPVLEVCTKESIANALLRMIIMGLNPAKRQCSFIAYGNQLSCQREYQGAIAIAKRHGVTKVSGCAVFKGDEFDFITDPETGLKRVTKHKQTVETIESGVVIAAYATKRYQDGTVEQDVMTMSQIRKAWEQGPTKGQSPAHKNFPDQMAIKTVIGRLLKADINSSDDSDLIIEDDEAPAKDQLVENVQYQIEDKGNKTPMKMDVPEEAPASDDSDPVDFETGEVISQQNQSRAPF